jgi:hypothetical protein
MGKQRQHYGPPCIHRVLREGLLDSRLQILHWLTCRECDPEEQAETMLAIVGWSPAEFLDEVMGDA